MRRTSIVPLLGLLATTVIAGSNEPVPGGGVPPRAPELDRRGADPSRGEVVGTVTQTMDVSYYTYVEIDTGRERIWVAGPRTEVNVGDTVSVSSATRMLDFFSNFLDRTFDVLYLAPSIELLTSGEAGAPGAPEPERREPEPPAEIDVSGIERVEGGYTIAEIFESRARLAGKEVAVRGKVVKFNSEILERNWIHLQDGTVGPGGAKDLVVTSDEAAEVGSTVIVRGTVVTDEDFGYGYAYDVLIREASITVE